VTIEHEKACKSIEECRSLRKKYFGGDASVVQNDELKDPNTRLTFQLGENGVMELYNVKDDPEKKNNMMRITNELPK
jgi:hypothetical protein